jgi:hypothetical protein
METARLTIRPTMNTIYSNKEKRISAIIDKTKKIKELQKTIYEKIDMIKTRYIDLKGKLFDETTELDKPNIMNKFYIFSTDTIYFQYKLFMMEMENTDQIANFFNNRIYCDYYHLYELLINYIGIETEEMKPTFSVYKVLDIYSVYSIEDLLNIHSTILKLIEQIQIKNIEISTDISNNILFINFINTWNNEKMHFTNDKKLFLNYLDFFHIFQIKGLENIYNKYAKIHENIDALYITTTVREIKA